MKKLITTMACLTVAMLPNIACSDLSNREAISEKKQISANVKSTSSNLFMARTAANANAEYVFNSGYALVEEIENNITLYNALRNPITNLDGSQQFINQNNLDHMMNIIG